MIKFKYILFVLCGAMVFTSCEEYVNSAEESAVTFLPVLSMNGPSNVVLDCTSTSYDDPGLTAAEAGVEIPVVVTTSSRYYGGSEINSPDVYDIVYSAENQDGIPGSQARTILVPECSGDFVSSIGGVYTANVVRNGAVSPQYMGLGPIIVKDLGDDRYAISDAIGGYYEHGRGFGFQYASIGAVVKANDIAGNDFEVEGANSVGLFGGTNNITSFSVDPVTKIINLVSDWDFNDDGVIDFSFACELIQD